MSTKHPFSSRLRWELHPNPLTELLRSRRRLGEPVIDLTISNPTVPAGEESISYPEERIREALAGKDIFRYEPDPKGLWKAREAVAEYYASIGANVHPEDIILTASTSEGYSYLFKLLCDPGSEALIPQPSYPLFDFVAGMDLVELHPYKLRYRDPRWEVDMLSLEAAAGEHTRAVIAINPNNPTGNYLSPDERCQMLDYCAAMGYAFIADEVFYEYPSPGTERPPSFAGVDTGEGLVFTLNGFSKMLGLPQMKLGWITIAGNEGLKSKARKHLELIADTYLSVNTPIMHAAPALLAMREEIALQIRNRCDANETYLREHLPGGFSLRAREGGWSAVVQLPEGCDADTFTMRLLLEEYAYAHPGHFYDFPAGDCIVLSLLTPPADFREGAMRIGRAAG